MNCLTLAEFDTSFPCPEHKGQALLRGLTLGRLTVGDRLGTLCPSDESPSSSSSSSEEVQRTIAVCFDDPACLLDPACVHDSSSLVTRSTISNTSSINQAGVNPRPPAVSLNIRNIQAVAAFDGIYGRARSDGPYYSG